LEEIMKSFVFSVCTSLAVGALLVPVLASQEQDDSTKALRELQGIWKLEVYESRGEKSLKDDSDDTLYVVVDDTLLVCSGHGLTRYKLKVDPTTNPKCLDSEMVSTSGVGATFFKHHERTVQEGIFELKGDELRVCFNVPDPPVKQRPQKFLTRQEGPEVFMYTLKREKPTAK
jgi:uncharacterized protein (TIGR03067 family)